MFVCNFKSVLIKPTSSSSMPLPFRNAVLGLSPAKIKTPSAFTLIDLPFLVALACVTLPSIATI